MSNTQATVEDLIDELTDVLEKGWHLPFAGGKSFIDSEDAKQILDEIREAIPSEVRKAKAIVADRAQIISEAQREAETIVRVAEEKAKALVNQEEIVRQAQAKANDIMAQTQEKFRSMQKASNDYVEDLLRRTDDAMSAKRGEKAMKIQSPCGFPQGFRCLHVHYTLSHIENQPAAKKFMFTMFDEKTRISDIFLGFCSYIFRFSAK